MKRTVSKSLLIILILLFGTACSKNEVLNTYSIIPSELSSFRDSYVNGELKDSSFVKDILNKSDELLDFKPLSVVDKDAVPPSGDKHDFLSMGPYWWPDSSKPDGLPYIRKDGQRNPETRNYQDDQNQYKVINAVETLSLCFYLTKDEKYAEKAAQLLRVWFLDKETKMNPNLNYAQFIPGISEGRGIGLIATRVYQRLVDALGLLETSTSWTKEDNDGMKDWFTQYFDWLINSKNGKDEALEKNNHGSWYDVQAASLALYLGKTDYAKKIIEEAKIKRITLQIMNDGKQPLELERTSSWHYSIFNLTALNYLAVLGDRVDVNLWDYTSENGGSLRKALDYLLPYINNFDKWEYQEIRGFETDTIYPLLLLAKSKFDKQIYSDWIAKFYNENVPNTIAVFYSN